MDDFDHMAEVEHQLDRPGALNGMVARRGVTYSEGIPLPN